MLFMGKLTMSMAIFNSNFDITRGYLETFFGGQGLRQPWPCGRRNGGFQAGHLGSMWDCDGLCPLQ